MAGRTDRHNPVIYGNWTAPMTSTGQALCSHLDSSCCSFEVKSPSAKMHLKLPCSRESEPEVVTAAIRTDIGRLTLKLRHAELRRVLCPSDLVRLATARAAVERSWRLSERLLADELSRAWPG